VKNKYKERKQGKIGLKRQGAADTLNLQDSFAVPGSTIDLEPKRSKMEHRKSTYSCMMRLMVVQSEICNFL
jgi:hypothetical protein